MALTVRGDGTGAAYLVQAAWWNDYYDLLTGAMHDQDVVFDYRPGVGNGKNTLTLKGDGFNYLLKGMETDGATEAFHVDSNGNASFAGNFNAVNGTFTGPVSIGGALTGVTSLTMAGALSGVTTIGASGLATLGSADVGTNLQLTSSGNDSHIKNNNGSGWLYLDYSNRLVFASVSYVDGSGHFFDNGNNVPYLVPNGTTAGRQIFLGTATPVGANEGDIWIKG